MLRADMDALAFLKKHGVKVCKQVAKAAGSNYEYFSQIAYGHRRPSVDKASALVSASERLIKKPSERLDLLSLLQAKKAAA